MRYFVVYLLMIAAIAATLSATTGALANGVVCELGSYGAIAQGCPGR